MVEERRHEARHVVDGLRAELDGVPQEILDISASGIRVVRTSAPPATADLRLVSEEAESELDLRFDATCQRSSPFDVVYRYRCTLADWPRRLAAFDVFADLAIPVLEGSDGT
jgi:hypothetical protein